MIKFKVKTKELTSALNTVEKGVGNSKIIPITEYLHFILKDGKLTISATDLNNFISYTLDEVEGDDLNIIIHATSIIKLAGRTTKEYMEFKIKDDYVEVKGNGTYKIELMIDEEFPEYDFELEKNPTKIEDITAFKRILKVNEQSISKEMITPVLSGYNVGEKVITTDGIKMCITDEAILTDSPVLLTQDYVELINTLTGESELHRHEDKILIKSKDVVIYGSQLEGIEDYPDITPILDIEHTGSVKVNKDELTSVLDRLLIFSDPFDNNGVELVFGEKHLSISDIKGKHNEKIKYDKSVEVSHKNDIKVPVNIHYLKDLLDVVTEKEVEIHYGEGIPLKIVDKKVVEILSIMELEE